MEMLALLPLLSGCLDEVLEGPYVLATGLGEARGVCPTARGSMLVATDRGVWEVDGNGVQSQILDRPATAVAAHVDRFYALNEGSIVVAGMPPPGQPAPAIATIASPGVVDIQAWCDDTLLAAKIDALVVLDPRSGAQTTWAAGFSAVRSVSLGPGTGCDAALVVSGDAVLLASPGGTRTLAAGLVHPRVAARDVHGLPWVVHGAPPVLSPIRDGHAEPFARFLGDPRDLHFGPGALFPPQNAYLADGEGTLDYVRVPD